MQINKYKYLIEGELIKIGDEFETFDGLWNLTREGNMNHVVQSNMKYRRRLPLIINEDGSIG